MSDTGTGPDRERQGKQEREPTPPVRKVIDLQGYLAAERALDGLLKTPLADPQYARQLTEALRYGPSLLACAVRRLDAFEPGALEALGGVAAAYPDRSEAIYQLTRAANDRRSPDSRRIAAMLVLEFCMGLAPDEDFLATLQDPTLSLALSLRGAVRHAALSSLLHGYVQGMLTQPSELLYALFRRLVTLEGDVPAEVGRALALHPDVELSLEVVDALAAQGSKLAVQTLALLEPSLSVEGAHAATRAIQKLRLAGYSPQLVKSPTEECRALLSPVDGAGNRLLALVAPSSGKANSGEYTLLELYLNDGDGVLEAGGFARLAARELPPPVEQGQVHRYTLRSWRSEAGGRPSNPPQSVSMLEVSYLYGLSVLRDAVRRNWQTVSPLPLDYCLLMHTFMEYSQGLSGYQSAPPVEEKFAQEFVAREADLLANPVFESWYLVGRPAQEVAQEISLLSGGPPRRLNDDNWRLLLPALIRLAHEEFGPEVRARYAHRLRLMSEWLRLSGQFHDAACAASASITMLKAPPETNLLVLRMVQLGILVALGNMPGR